MGLFLSGCNIYFNGTDGAADGVGNDGMHVTFAISAGHPDYAGTKASSYGTPSLEDGTEWDQATDDTMNTNLVQVSFSPSSLDFVKIGTNLYRLYIPEHPNKRTDVERASISVSMTQNKVTTGGTILFEGKSSTSSTSKTALNILRNSYYKFCIRGINKYSTEAVFDVVPFDDVNNDIVFE